MKRLIILYLVGFVPFYSFTQAPILFRDFNPGPASSASNLFGHHLEKVNGHIVFGAVTDEHPSEEILYSINGLSGSVEKLPTGNGFYGRDEMLSVIPCFTWVKILLQVPNLSFLMGILPTP